MSSNSSIVIGVSAVDTARQTLQQVDSKIRETTTIIEDSGAKITTIGQRIKDNWQNLAATATGLVSGVTGFATSFDVLQKAQTNADRANLTYQKSLAKLEEMQKSGKYSAEELARQQEQVRINSEKLAQAQDNLGDTYTNFLANIPAQMLGFGTAAIGMFNMLRTTQIANAAASVTSSVAYSGALASMNAATITTTGALNGFRIASIMAFLTNPATAAILGISTLIVLLTTNAFGLRDAFVWLGETIYNTIVSAFQPLIDILGTLFGKTNDVNAAIGRDMPTSVGYAGQALDGLKDKTGEVQGATDNWRNSIIQAKTTLDTDLPASVAVASSSLDGLKVKLGEVLQVVDQVKVSVSKAPTGTDTLGISDTITAVATRPSIVASVTSAAKQAMIGKTGGAATAAYFNTVTSGATVKKNALGGEGIVTSPTLFLAGENGPEFYKFTPASSEGRVPSSDGIGDLNITIIQKGTDIESVEAEIAGRRRKKYSLRKQGVYGGH